MYRIAGSGPDVFVAILNILYTGLRPPYLPPDTAILYRATVY